MEFYLQRKGQTPFLRKNPKTLRGNDSASLSKVSKKIFRYWEKNWVLCERQLRPTGSRISFTCTTAKSGEATNRKYKKISFSQ